MSDIQREPNGRKSRRTDRPRGGRRTAGEGKRVGRPPGILNTPHADSLERDELIHFLLKPSERAELETRAARHGFTFSDFVRYQLGLETPAPSAAPEDAAETPTDGAETPTAPAKKETRSYDAHIRVNAAERREIERSAAHREMTITNYVRGVLDLLPEQAEAKTE